MHIDSNQIAREGARKKVSPFVLMKEKVGYEEKVKGFYCCENCQNLLTTRRGHYCRVIGYDPSDPESQVDLGSKCRSHAPGRLTTLEEGK